MSVKQMALVWELDLAPNKRLVLLAYADHADDDGDNVFPSLGRVAHKTGYSVDQVRRISRELASDGLMEKVEEGVGRGNTHRYKLTLEKGSKTPPFEPKQKTAEKVASAPKKVASRREKVAPMPPEPSEPSSLEPSSALRGGKPPQEPKKPSAFPYMQRFADLLDTDALPLSSKERGKLASQIQRRLDKGADEKKIRAAMCRLVTRRNEGERLEFNDVWGDRTDPPRKRGGSGQRRQVAAGSIAVIGATDDDYNVEDYR